MGKKRLRKIRNRNNDTKKKVQVSPQEIVPKDIRRTKQDNVFLEFYDKNYKMLLIIPFVILILALGQIAFQTITTGEFISRGVSLTGGITVTIPTDKTFDTANLKTQLLNQMPGRDIEIRVLKSAGTQTAVIIESDISDIENTNEFVDLVEKETGISQDDYNLDVMGSSLGESFFKEIMFALVIAFIFMGVVVFLYFRTLVPSAAVILAAFSDMVVTVAVVNIMEIKLSTAGIAAFLMLIGYSIDTDILLSTRLLKRKDGTVFERVIQSAKTGLTMNFSTMSAIIVILIFSNSEVLTQIMTILLIGLTIDIINTWIQNVGILRLYLERKKSE
jgi:preprotein translocase subunit SecF